MNESSVAPVAETSVAGDPMPVILLVDDEASILSSLKRLFRPHGYKILTAESGAQGLELMATETVDLVISDMRMPGMTGAQFLALAKERFPDTVRILLTGYSEISATIAAINDGGIYHYLPKPWDERDLLLTVQRALEQQQLKQEKERLAAVVQRQNQELQAFNQNLEKQVVARTEEIRQTVLFLEKSEEDIKKNFLTMLKVFSSMIELRSGAFSGQSARVGELSRKLGAKLGLTVHAQQELMISGLLHAIGKIGLSDELVRKPMEQMTSEENRLFMSHPLKGQMVLTPIEAFTGAGHIIRHQFERYDGRGTPESLVGQNIPLGARILSLVRDFDSLKVGAIASKPLPFDKIIHLIKSQSGHRYDPQIVNAFLALIEEDSTIGVARTRMLKPDELVPGMQLAEDLLAHDGVLLLTKDCIINLQNTSQIKRFAQHESIPMQISVAVQ